MDRLEKYFNDFQQIGFSYEGESTNWEEKDLALKCLIDDLQRDRLHSSKHSSYYNWIKRVLLNEMNAEEDRVYKLMIKQKEGLKDD